MQDATAQVRRGREGEGGREECVPYYTQLCVLFIFLRCVYYTDGSASVYQQRTTKGQFVNFHQPLFILECLWPDDVTESYNCFSNIHSGDVTHIFIQWDMVTSTATLTLGQYSILLRVLLAVWFHQGGSDVDSSLAILLLTSYLGHMGRGVAWVWSYCANLAQAMNTAIPFPFVLEHIPVAMKCCWVSSLVCDGIVSFRDPQYGTWEWD